MTFDLSLRSRRKRNQKTTARPVMNAVTFPFQHYKFDENDELVCVGKSHWQGGMKNGYFAKDLGTINNNLARMFMKLVERYATRSNWRGYTYNDEMKSTALLQLSANWITI